MQIQGVAHRSREVISHLHLCYSNETKILVLDANFNRSINKCHCQDGEDGWVAEKSCPRNSWGNWSFPESCLQILEGLSPPGEEWAYHDSSGGQTQTSGNSALGWRKDPVTFCLSMGRQLLSYQEEFFVVSKGIIYRL